MTLHDSVSRLAFLLSMRAAFIAIACSLGAPAFAVDVKAIAPRRPPRLSFELIPSHTRRPVAVAAATNAGERVERFSVNPTSAAMNQSRPAPGPSVCDPGGPARSRQIAARSGVSQPAPIQAALDLLKWSPDHVPQIEVVDVCPPQVSPLAEGWTVYGRDGNAQPTIYVAGWSALYRAILANGLDVHFSVIRLAGVLAHERAHIEHGQNEEAAYLAQLTTLEHLRAHDIDLANVRRALEVVRRQQRGGR
jgi:Zn-dependent protease with chaperone function